MKAPSGYLQSPRKVPCKVPRKGAFGNILPQLRQGAPVQFKCPASGLFIRYFVQLTAQKLLKQADKVGLYSPDFLSLNLLIGRMK